MSFHRILRGLLVPTGDPTGTGASGPGYRFEDEPVQREDLHGAVAMANAAPHTIGFLQHTPYLSGGLPSAEDSTTRLVKQRGDPIVGLRRRDLVARRAAHV